MSTNSHDIGALNSLLATVVDSIDGFEQAAKSADANRYTSLFEDVAADRRRLAAEIETQIGQSGGTPEEEGTMLASAHRVLMRLRDVTGGDAAVVAEAERGEDHIKAKFEKAAADEALSPAIRQFVAQAAARVKAGHDRIRDLKHALQS